LIWGGAIFNWANSVLLLDNTRLRGNVASPAGGGIENIVANSASGSDCAGVIGNNVHINQSTDEDYSPVLWFTGCQLLVVC